LQQPQTAELQEQTVRQHTEIPNGKKLPLISPEPPKTESLFKQPPEVALQTSKLTPARFEPPDIQTIPVVRQQLEILNTSQFAWQGEAWNGQRMEWTIRREEGRKHSPTPRKWETDLRLELPRLGAISASISITGNQVRLSISASDTDTAEMMKTRKNRLIEGMESCDLVLSGLEVSHDPSP
jgi:flagellar hook-length control protein FliK